MGFFHWKRKSSKTFPSPIHPFRLNRNIPPLWETQVVVQRRTRGFVGRTTLKMRLPCYHCATLLKTLLTRQTSPSAGSRTKGWVRAHGSRGVLEKKMTWGGNWHQAEFPAVGFIIVVWKKKRDGISSCGTPTIPPPLSQKDPGAAQHTSSRCSAACSRETSVASIHPKTHIFLKYKYDQNTKKNTQRSSSLK